MRTLRQRGVALVFALFTTAVLITMSLTFVALSIRHGQTSTATNHTQSALHAANWALDFAMNYMGDGSNWTISSRDSSGFVLSFHLGPKVQTFQGLSVRVENAGGAVRKLSFPDFTMPIDARTSARMSVTAQEILMPGQPTHYRLVSTGEVIDSGGQVLATRVVEARVREQSAADFLHFVQNARAWDAPGVDAADELTNDIVGIPSNYKESGKMRVDGGGRVAQTAGNLRLYGTEDVRFDGNVTISQDGNLYPSQIDQETEAGIFTGGLSAGAQSLGLPNKEHYVSNDKNANGIIEGGEQGYSQRQAADTAGGNFVNGFIEVGGSNADVGNGSAYADVEMDPSGRDRRPGIATVEIILNGNTVTVQKVSRYSGKVKVLHQNVSVDQFKNGVIHVEGGNVKIKSRTDSSGKPVPFTGQLTVVSNEQASRNALRADGQGNPVFNPTSIYHQAARDYFERRPHESPPYTAQQLGLSGNGKYWPPPQENVEREGNTIIASDVKYGDTGSEAPSLGIVSKNFVLLNDELAGRKGASGQTLEVDAVLMSLDHSVQFDWDNLGNNPFHGNLLSPQGGSGKRTFKFNGSIVGGYMDVEGDVRGRGYTIQEFTHDENLRFNLPPAFPRWDRTAMPPGVVLGWVVMQYVDRGAISGMK